MKSKSNHRDTNKQQKTVKKPDSEIENTNNKFIDINFNKAFTVPPTNLMEAFNYSSLSKLKDQNSPNLKETLNNLKADGIQNNGNNPSINFNISINVYNKFESTGKIISKLPHHLSLDTVKSANFNKSSIGQLTFSKHNIENNIVYKSKSSKRLEVPQNLLDQALNQLKFQKPSINCRSKSDFIDSISNKKFNINDAILYDIPIESKTITITPSILTGNSNINLVQLKVVNPNENEKSQSNLSGAGKSSNNSVLISNNNLDGSNLLSSPNRQHLGLLKVNQKFSKNSVLSFAEQDKRELMKVSTSLSMIEVNLHLRIRETLNYHNVDNPILLVGSEKLSKSDFINSLMVFKLISNLNLILSSEHKISSKIKWPLIKHGHLFVSRVSLFREDVPDLELTEHLIEVPLLLFNFTSGVKQSINELNYRVVKELIDQVDALNYHTPIFMIEGSIEPSVIYFLIKFSIDCITSK